MDSFHSHRTQLVFTALAASLTTFWLINAYGAYSRKALRKSLNEDALRSVASNLSNDGWKNSVSDPDHPDINNTLGYTDELMREQLARNYAFFGEDAMSKIRAGSVAIVGCGGVGSWAAVMLARSGVSNIRLIDFDYVTLSSLNRHATAGIHDVGMPKVNCIERTLKEVARGIEVDSRMAVWRKEDGGPLLEGVDWVVDAIDNVSTKVDLLKYCHDHRIPVFSSMGAGAKCDPTRIQISDISDTIYDPLARSVRRRLRVLGVSSGIPVVYSTEVPSDIKLLPLPEEEFQKGNVHELSVLDDFRVRILPVIGSLPAIFGLNIATYILCELAGKPILNPLSIKNRKKLYEKLLRDLLPRESKLIGEQVNKLPIDEDDVALIFEDLYCGRSVVPPHCVPARPVLARWDPERPLTVENCVVFDYPECEKHVRECYGENEGERIRLPPGNVWGSEVERMVNMRAEEAARCRAWFMGSARED